MSLNPLIVKSYRVEYESTDITIEALKAKYKLPADFDTSHWKKPNESTPPVDVKEPAPNSETKVVPKMRPKAKLVKKKLVDTRELTPLDIAPIEGEKIVFETLDKLQEDITASMGITQEMLGKQLPDLRQPSTPEILTPDVVEDEHSVMKRKIVQFKEAAIDHALSFMENDIEFAEVKEFKDMVAIVDSIDKSLKDSVTDSGTTVNVLIQNIMNEFQDDC